MGAFARVVLALSQGIVSLTALAGGFVLIASAALPPFESSWAPPPEYLRGTPFRDYLIPGIALVLFLGVLQALACVLTIRRRGPANVISTVAGFAVIVWIFVQMIYIPFSGLQVAYFAVGILQLAVVMLQLGVLAPSPQGARRSAPS